MKRLLLIALVAMFAATSAFAQFGQIGLFSDVGGNDCNITDAVPGLKPVYAVHTNAVGVAASAFRAIFPACWAGASYLSDAGVFAVTVGNSQLGVAVGYGSCLNGPIHVLTINVFAGGTGTPCCAFKVDADPRLPSGQIEVVDCADNLIFLGTVGGWGIINTDGTCDCDVASRDATWGNIKALYSVE